ncbi:MAG: crotonase [Hirschia sp.]|nr:crotonase [Hirschia sp.]MBF17393.1 crotonase [Hirschia sp.]|tara:strand:- start:732 stop:1562 length:831 start_codon:yes stop_codon:yes gene_type:complete
MTIQTIDGIRVDPGETIDWIVLDRPEAANAFNNDMLERFSRVLSEMASTGAPVIGIRGEGRGFGAGMDLGEYQASSSPVDDVLRLSSYVDRWMAIWRHPKPVIFAVHGYCIGVAAQMAAFADMLVVAEDCMISEPTIPIGGGFIAPSWVNQVGARKAKEFAFLPGNHIDGLTAVEWGWANAAVPADKLVECVEHLAKRIALVPSGVLAVKKRSINRAMEAAGFSASVSAVSESDAILHLDPDVQKIRQDLATSGLKKTISQFRGDSSQEIFHKFQK